MERQKELIAYILLKMITLYHCSLGTHFFYTVVLAADTVNSSETLDNANRIPVNVIVHQIVAVLQVLTFGDTVGGYQNVNLLLTSWQQDVSALGYG